MSTERPGGGRVLLALATLGVALFALLGGAPVSPVSAQVDDPYQTTTTQPGGTTTTTTPGGTTTTTTPGGTTTTTTPGGTTTTTTPGGTTTTTTPGGTTTTTQPDVGGEVFCRVSIEISVGQGPVGVRIRVRARCFPPGAVVTFTFNGRPMGQGTATPTGGTTALSSDTPVLAAVVPDIVLRQFGVGDEVAQATGPDTVAETTFDIPSVANGTYPVCAHAAGLEPVCTTFRVVPPGTSGTSVLGRTFARTGLTLLPLLAVGAGAVVVGRTLRRSGGRGRRT